MACGNATKQLMHIPLDQLWGEKAPRYQCIDLFLEIQLQVLEHQVHLGGAHDDILELHHIFMIDLPQHGYLPNRGARHTLTLCLQLDLLECNDLIGTCVETLVHDAIGAFTQLFNLLDVLDLAEAELAAASALFVYHDNLLC